MKLSRHLTIPGWDDSAARSAAGYWRGRGFMDLHLEDGPILKGKRGSALFPYGRERGGPLDLDWGKLAASLEMVPGDGDGVRVHLDVITVGWYGRRLSEWGVAHWRLEIVGLQHLLWGEPLAEAVWTRFETDERVASRAWLWTRGFARRRLAATWETEISELETKFLLASGGAH